MEVIAEYENCLLGKIKTMPQCYFSYEEYTNEKIALRIMKYAFETYLKWNPFVLRDHLTMNILEKLKLKQLLRYISFPPELDPKRDLFYLAWRIYPQTIHFSENDLVLKVYRELLSGEIKRFPKEFFTGIDGLTRAGLCLQYMIEQYVHVSTIPELYSLFASNKGTTLLRKYKLLAVCEDSFRNPVDFLHYSLPPSQKDNLMFSYCTFTYERRMLEAAENEECGNAQ